jgi:hypothetical protein
MKKWYEEGYFDSFLCNSGVLQKSLIFLNLSVAVGVLVVNNNPVDKVIYTLSSSKYASSNKSLKLSLLWLGFTIDHKI